MSCSHIRTFGRLEEDESEARICTLLTADRKRKVFDCFLRSETKGGGLANIGARYDEVGTELLQCPKERKALTRFQTSSAPMRKRRSSGILMTLQIIRRSFTRLWLRASCENATMK